MLKTFVHNVLKCSVSNLQQSSHSRKFFRLESKSNEPLKITCPDFSQYLYFLFAPTLIYRDKYPRNAMINWGFVLQMFAQVFGAIVYVYYIVVRFCVPTFANLNQSQITLPIFLTVLFNSIMPGSLFLLLGKENEWIVDHAEWFLSQVFTDFYIAGWMHLLKCYDLLIECFTK